MSEQEQADELGALRTADPAPWRVTLLGICACWQVWADWSHEMSAHAQTSRLKGEWGNGEMMRDASRLLQLETLEAYARGQLQCFIVNATNGLDQTAQYHAHWVEFWGDKWADAAAEEWRKRYEAELAQLQRNEGRAQQTAAAWKAQGL